MTKEDILKQCKVEGNIVKLPEGQLDRKLYQDVAKALELIGGKWKGGKIFGFVFQEDPTDLLNQIAGGEVRNLKKEFQFFGTPDGLGDTLVELAEIKIEHEILEPHLGQGALVRAIHRALGCNSTVYGYELMPINRSIVEKIPGVRLLGDDFLKNDTQFDRIIANPPFTKNQDIRHICAMYNALRHSGRLVSLASQHWKYSTNSEETEFRNWLDAKNATVRNVPAGAFKESGTNVASCIVVIDKL